MRKRKREVTTRIRRVYNQNCSYRLYLPKIWIDMIQKELGGEIKAVKVETMPDKSLRITPFISKK